MALRDEMAASGYWLFRRRSEFPLLLLALVLFELWLRPPRPWPPGAELAWTLLCVAVGSFGEFVRVYTVGHAPGGTSHRGTDAPAGKVLNTSGVYAAVRHPLYFGNYFMWLGPALMVRSWEIAVIVSLVFWVFYERIMYAEERFLRGRFGAEYDEWAARTPAFLPRLSQLTAPPERFSFRLVLRREHSSMFALVATFTFLIYARDYLDDGVLQPHPIARIVFPLALLLFIGAVVLTRSGVLHVKGR